MTTALIITMITLLAFGFPMLVPLLAATMLGFIVYLGLGPDFMIQQMLRY